VFWLLVVSVALFVVFGVYESFPEEDTEGITRLECIEDKSIGVTSALIGGIILLVLAVVVAVIYTGYICSPFVYDKRWGRFMNSDYFMVPHFIFFAVALVVIILVAVGIPFCRELDEFDTPDVIACLSFCNHYRTASIVAVVLTGVSIFIESIAWIYSLGTLGELYESQKKLEKL
jgi:hypothetical protein